MDRQLEVLAKIVGKRLNLLGLDPFGAGHTQREPNHDLLYLIVTDYAMEIGEVVFLILPVQCVKALSGNTQGVRDGDPNAARSDVKSEDAAW